MWKESNRNIVVIFQPNILRIVGFYVRHSAKDDLLALELKSWNKSEWNLSVWLNLNRGKPLFSSYGKFMKERSVKSDSLIKCDSRITF